MDFILEPFKSIYRVLSSSKKVTDISSFHYDLFLTGFTGLVTLSKVFQLNWDVHDWLELFSQQNRILEVFTITTIILNVLLLIDYSVHYNEQRNGQVPIMHALTILIFVNSLAMFITFVILYSQQDRKIGIEMSFLNVAAGYIVPVISFAVTFIYSLYTYIYGNDYENQVAKLESQEKKLDGLLEKVNKLQATESISKESKSCLMM